MRREKEKTGISEVVTSPRWSLKVDVGATTTPTAVFKYVDELLTQIGRQDATAQALRHMTGRVLAEIQDRKLYKGVFDSFEAYTTHLAQERNLSRRTIRNYLMEYRALPFLTPADVENIPQGNIHLAARIMRDRKSPSPKFALEVLTAAGKDNLVEFQKEARERGWVVHHEQGKAGMPGKASGKARSVTVSFTLTQEENVRWLALVGDRDPKVVFLSFIPAVAVKGRVNKAA